MIFLEKSPRPLDPEFADAIFKNSDHVKAVFQTTAASSIKKYQVEFLVLKLVSTGVINCSLERDEIIARLAIPATVQTAAPTSVPPSTPSKGTTTSSGTPLSVITNRTGTGMQQI